MSLRDRLSALAPWGVAACGVVLGALAPARAGMASGVVLAYAGFCAAIVGGHRRRRARLRDWSAGSDDATLIAYASQTGYAEQLAMRTAHALQGAGVPVQLFSFADLDASHLARCRQALFLVSTTGEGDAPDSAAGFARKLVARGGSLGQLRYGILALGDSSYARFCAFGHTLSAWLQRQQARPLFDLVEVDNGDAGALRHWQNHLSALGGGAEIADWERPRYGAWRLAERTLLNPGSAGGPAFHLALVPEDPAALDWQAGDIAEVGPCHAMQDVTGYLDALGLDRHAPVRCDGEDCTLVEALVTRIAPSDPQATAFRGLAPQELVDALPRLPHREYSIASIPQDGRLELLVRQATRDDGTLGLASGWLTAHAAVGGRIAMRVRPNRSFHGPVDDRPLILIGNGTGLAGLRAHLKARAHAGRHRNWLLFGERSAAHDGFHADELAAWQRDGVIERMDLTFSRDGHAQRYVQDAVRAQGAEIGRWVEQGAAIYVCGSLQGMAAGVDAALAEVLGVDALRALAEAGRYRRDVY